MSKFSLEKIEARENLLIIVIAIASTSSLQSNKFIVLQIFQAFNTICTVINFPGEARAAA